MQNVQKHPKTGVWRVRKVVPPAAVAKLGRRVFLISLQTRDHAEAKRLALPILSRIENEIAAGLTGSLSPQAFLRQLPPVPWTWPEGLGWPVFKTIGELDRAILDFARESNVTLGGFELVRFRRLVQAESWMQNRQTKVPGQGAPPELVDKPLSETGRIPLLSQVYEAWKSERRPTQAAIDQTDVVIKRFAAKYSDLPITKIDRAKAIEFKSDLSKLPGRKSELISPDTVNKQLALIQTVIEYAVKNDPDGKLGSNPFRGVVHSGRDNGAQRRPFESAELAKLFGPDYQSQSRGNYWIPLLSLFTGARMNELTQLHRDDIVQTDGVHAIRIDTRHDGQQVKNRSSRRVIPIHPKLIELGFLEYIAEIRDGRLFPEQTRTTMVKHWARWSNRCGVTDPTTSFHSFRHSFVDGCRRAKMEEAVQDALTGHSGSRMGRRYGSGYSLPQLFEAINAVSYPGFPR